MQNKYISLLVKAFFEGRASEENRNRFHTWFMDNDSREEKEDAVYDMWEKSLEENIPPASGKELKEMHKRIRRHGQSPRVTMYRLWARIAAFLVLPLAGAALSYLWMHDEVPQAVAPEVEIVECYVPHGERKHFILPDGTEVWLNSGSLLMYDKQFAGNMRSLFLSGEANFNVARNEAKPFVVRTEYMNVKALGTVFNVQAYPDARKSIATLESGKVEVQAKSDSNNLQSVVTLLPNEQLVYDHVAGEFVTKKVEASRNTKWIEGFTVFQGNNLDEIVSVIERNYKVKVQYDASRFKGRIFTMRFSPDEDINQVFDILKRIAGFRYSIQDNIVYIQ